MRPALMRAVPPLLIAAMIAAAPVRAQEFRDAAAITQFQRAADGYAFTHRQTDRRGSSPEVLQEGAIFTPVVAAAFRARVAASLRRDGCSLPADTSNVVPRVNAQSSGAALVPQCVAAALPRLPDELEYRMSGVVLVLSDAHRHIVVDVVHAAFPLRDK